MATPDPPRARRWFRRLLALLPFDTRREYGREMEDVFMLEHRDRTRGGQRAERRLWAETAAGVLAFASREQWSATRDDLRQAVRGWRRAPLLFVVLVATMCAGIAGVTSAFAVVDAVLLRPLPVPDPSSLVRVGESHRDAPILANVTLATFLDIEQRAKTVTGVAAARFWYFNLTGQGEPERLQSARVSGAFFRTLGARPALGRLLADDDDRTGRDNVAVISDGLWRRRFGASEAIVGRRIDLSGQPTEVIGVLAPGAEFPLGTDVWVPLVARGSGLETNRRYHGFQVLARLAPGATLASVQAELGVLAADIDRANPGQDPDLELRPESVLERVVAPVRASLWTTLVASVLLVVVLATNVAQVQLARAAGREREVAVRAALGASRGRIARLLLTETLALSVVAATLGLVAAWLLVRALPAWLPANLPRADALVFDWRAAAVGAGVALFAGLAFGIWPALRATRAGRLQGTRVIGATDRRSGATPGRWLAALQLSLTFALLVVAGLVIASAIRSSRLPLGFTSDALVRVDLSLASDRIADPADGDAYVAVLDPLLRRLEAVPGVTNVGLSTTAPLDGGAATSYAIVGESTPEGREPLADIRIVDPGFFGALDVPLLAGRTFTTDDRARSRPVVVVNDTLVRRHFPDGRASGRSITMLNWGPPLTAEIVGVVGDVVGRDLEAPVGPTIYWHYPQFPQVFVLTMFVRADREAASIVPEIRRAIWELEPNLPLPRIERMSDTILAARAQRRTFTGLLVALSGAAALVALVGLYGVLSHQATRDVPAYGIRMALGARPGDVARLVVADAGRVATVGLAIGAALGLLSGRLIESLLYQTSARDAGAFAAAGGALVVSVLLAALGPALRAARVDPISALRQE